MSKFSLKAGGGRFLLDDEHVYYAIFTKEEERDFVAERGKSKGKRFVGLNFYYEIINDRELLEGTGSSRGKQLREFFFANDIDDEGYVFPDKGVYRATLEVMADFLGKDMDEIDDTEDLFGSVVVLSIKNSGGDAKDDVEYSNIDSIRGVSEKRMDKVKQVLKEYKVWKKEQDEEDDEDTPKKKSKPSKDVEKKEKKKDNDDDFDEDDDDEKKEDKKEKKKVEEKKEEKKGKKKDSDDDDNDDDDDGFFNDD